MATPTGQLGPHVADHLEVGRHILQHLRDVFADLAKLTPAVWTTGSANLVSMFFAGQMGWQGFAGRLVTCGRRLGCRYARELLRYRRVLIERQPPLGRDPRQPFATTAELLTLQLGHQQF